MRDDLLLCSNTQVSLPVLIVTQKLPHQKKLVRPYFLLPPPPPKDGEVIEFYG